MFIRYFFACAFLLVTFLCNAQPGTSKYKWAKDGNSYFMAEKGEIVQTALPSFAKTTIVDKPTLTPVDSSHPLKIQNFAFSDDGSKVLIFTNTERVWRYQTRGDYWLLDMKTKALHQVGKGLPKSSLMFAKISPDGSKVAYVSKHNLYEEAINGGNITQLTTDGTDKLINGTFDWVYEEELGCRDGFRWSPDSKQLAFWQIDARQVRNFLMIDNTDSIYSFNIPVEYPKVGEAPSPYKIGVINVASKQTVWMDIAGDPRQHYLPRMEWAANSSQLVMEQLNRKQNESNILYADVTTGKTNIIHTETNKTWVDTKSGWNDNDPVGWEWMPDGKSFLWVSEKDGWRHIYLISRDGKNETTITKGNYDIMSIEAIDDKKGYVYFMASPTNATQLYLYRIKLDGKSEAELLLSSPNEKGTHGYQISTNGMFAQHSFSNANTPPINNWVQFPGNTIIAQNNQPIRRMGEPLSKVEFIQITTEDGVTMDGFVVKPTNFDSTKKYPVVFYVYTEPWSATAKDSYGVTRDRLYNGDMAKDGYIYISLDGRGTPAPKGAAWRKAIYRNIGTINIRDQAMAAKKILQWPYVDTSRIAVWGWSGGASTTLNLLFQYPEIYKTGIAIAAVANQLTYDNIYQERYMGLPQENLQDFVKGSPITYAKNLVGNLLYVHGTGDDNVHYQNAEMLLNELIKYNKIFQFMPYPNRTHSISEGEGTSRHLANLYTHFLQQYCPPGGR